MEVRSEGIVYLVTPYQETHEIATLFGPEGKMSLLRKYGRSKKNSPLMPLARYEVLYEPGKGELSHLKEIHLMDPFLKIRNSLATVHAGMEILSALQKTQGVNVDAQNLYLLVRKILESLPQAIYPQTLISAFYLKLLLHEGLLPLEELDLEMAELTACRSIALLCQKEVSQATAEQIKKLFMESV